MISLKPAKKDLGDGMMVRRLLPAMESRHVGPFVFFDHFGPATVVTGSELAVRPHPHIGLSTLTWLLSGAIWHKDSLGNELRITPGAVNWMTAGRGIVHSERTRKDASGSIMHGMQFWIALPADQEDCEPEFQHVPASEIPSWNEGGIRLNLIAGDLGGFRSPVNTFSKLFLAQAVTEASVTGQTKFSYEGEAAAYLVRGELTVSGVHSAPGELLILPLSASVTLEAGPDTLFLLLGGEPLPERRFMYWNFVSSSREKIESAKAAWRENRFPAVPGETERIPLPEE